MKCIIIGLGNFGSSLAEKLTQIGHEVIGVDHKMSKVEAMKEKVSHTVCLDCTDEQAVTHLPLKDTDVVIVCIGENEGANLMATALMKKHEVKRLICRAISPLHETVLEAMGLEEIVHPEEETANRWSKKLNLSTVVDSFELTGDYSIIEAPLPAKFAGKTVGEIGFRKNFNIVVLTTLKVEKGKNIFGAKHSTSKAQGVASSQTKLEKNDIVVLYGHVSDIEAFLTEG